MRRLTSRLFKYSKNSTVFSKNLRTISLNNFHLKKIMTRSMSGGNSSKMGFTKPNSHPKLPKDEFESICLSQLKKFEKAFREMKSYESRIEVINLQPSVVDLEIEIAGIVLNHELTPDTYTESNRPQKWLQSILEINTPEWSADQWNCLLYTSPSPRD